MEFKKHFENAIFAVCIPFVALIIILGSVHDHYSSLAENASKSYQRNIRINEDTQESLYADGGKFMAYFAPRLTFDKDAETFTETQELRFSPDILNGIYESVPGVNEYIKIMVENQKIETINHTAMLQLSALKAAEETCKLVSENSPQVLPVSKKSLSVLHPENISLNLEYCGEDNPEYEKALRFVATRK